MIKNILTDTPVKTHLSAEFIAALTQACQNQMAHPCAKFTQSLTEIAYIAFIASEQSQYRHTECRQFYRDLTAAEFQINLNAWRPFLDRFITCLDSVIENIRLLNHHTLLSPYHHDSSLKAIKTLLGRANPAIMDNLDYQFLRPLKNLPQLLKPLADTSTQRLADQFADIYKDDLLSSEGDRRAFMAQLTPLVNEGRPLCAKESDYAIHYQQFNYYGTLSYFERWDALAEWSYGLARMVELVANTQDTPQRRDFFAHLEAILGKPVNLPTQQAA